MRMKDGGLVEPEADQESCRELRDVHRVLGRATAQPGDAANMVGLRRQGPRRPRRVDSSCSSSSPKWSQPDELPWTGKTIGIPAIHVYRLHPAINSSLTKSSRMTWCS
jgi:hypothetical protein